MDMELIVLWSLQVLVHSPDKGLEEVEHFKHLANIITRHVYCSIHRGADTTDNQTEFETEKESKRMLSHRGKFEIWFWRRMMKIKRTYKMTNEDAHKGTILSSGEPTGSEQSACSTIPSKEYS